MKSEKDNKKNTGRNKKTFIGMLAIFANLFLAVGKILIGIISNSAAIIADGVNSATDVIASSIGFIGIKAAEKPADKEHPYGHEKAEVIAGFVITLIIFASALWIVYDAIKGFFTNDAVSLTILSFSVMAFSALINAVMSQLKIHFGKKYDSISLVSDGVHSRIDLLVSIGIFVGLFFIHYFPNTRFDSILALLVGIFILKEAFSLGKETTDSLLGVSASEDIEKKIKKIVDSKEKSIELKELKTQKIGSKVFAELTIKLPSKVKVEESSNITKNIEKELIEKIPSLEYTAIKVESHDVTYGFHKSAFGFGKGLGWQRRGRFKSYEKNKDSKEEADEKEIAEKAQRKGPEGFCKCPNPKCDYKTKHQRGVPCFKEKCPKCGKELVRE